MLNCIAESIQCAPIRPFGKRHLEDVTLEVNTVESVANWCAVDTRTGRLACVLEENYCFDAEVYADELGVSNPLDFREDQRSKQAFELVADADIISQSTLENGSYGIYSISSLKKNPSVMNGTERLFSLHSDLTAYKDPTYRPAFNCPA